VLIYLLLASVAVMAYLENATWLSAMCLVGLSVLSFRFAWRARVNRYTCVVCANTEATSYGMLRDTSGVVPCAACNSWLLVRLDNGAPWIKDHISKADFDEWIAYAGSRMAALEAIERKWGSAPAELAIVRREARLTEEAKEPDLSALEPVFGVLGFFLVVALVLAAVWAAISAIRWAWTNPLF
jgi:hypothetical protein